ncbi:3-hydroxyisobutyryl-CoA hydrolase-like protein 1, mitochondrial isoform X1 [Nicotiana sylvestris]|uniref:3-hydroxyisobutyryl-CoA hydrolase-like protein 1, mitochondrial isoform X1 n=1 Tax=Nicotiana sylvestris TaxID=4096 RepID=UPI00388C63ED
MTEIFVIIGYSSCCSLGPKFQVALLYGITMGGGAAISIPGTFRVATEKTFVLFVLCRIETLNKCFCHETVEEIIDSLESEAGKTADAWCISTLKRLREVSPLSLKVSLRSIREGDFKLLTSA